MIDFILPLAFAALVWWFSTGIILWLIRRPRRQHGVIGMGATLIMGAATLWLLLVRNDVSIFGAYTGFTTGILLWGWHEIMFLLGFISGPRKQDCPAGLPGWSRFRVATETVIHHELAIAYHALIIAIITWPAQNRIALWTFLVLWGMRLSTKLIVFFGVPNITDHFLPDHLRYLKTYFRKRQPNLFFFMAITLVTTAAALIVAAALEAPFGSAQSIGLSLVATLAVLAVIEHWALIVPFPERFWNWALSPDSQAPELSKRGPLATVVSPKPVRNGEDPKDNKWRDMGHGL